MEIVASLKVDNTRRTLRANVVVRKIEHGEHSWLLEPRAEPLGADIADMIAGKICDKRRHRVGEKKNESSKSILTFYCDKVLV